MPLHDGASEEVVRANISELIRSGWPADQAAAIAFRHAHPGHRRDGGNELIDWYVCARHDRGLPARPSAHRCDALPAHGQYQANLLAVHRASGHARPRRPHAIQLYPRSLEQDYGTRLVRIVDKARRVYSKLAAELPRLLAKYQQRGDAIATYEQLAASAAAAHVQLAERDGEPDLEPEDEHDKQAARITIAGIPIAIENPAGSIRNWSDGDRTGSCVMKFSYGFIDGAIGGDGDEVDVYLGPTISPAWVFVVHQMKAPDFAEWDEDKVMLGWDSADDAYRAYVAQYDDVRFFGGMSVLSLHDFKAALISLRPHSPIEWRQDAGDLTHVDAGELEFAKKLIDQAEGQMSREISDKDIESLASYFFEQTNRTQRAAIAKQLSSALGIDVIPDDRFVSRLRDYFIHENTTLISSIPSELRDDVAKLTARAFSKRMHPDTFMQLLQERFGIAENRARLIARDQIGSLHGQLNQARQKGLGIEAFFWRDQGDNRVRPEHRARNGKRFVWDEMDPDEVPGVPIACRCVAQPDTSGIFAAAEERMGHRRPVLRWPGAGVGPR